MLAPGGYVIVICDGRPDRGPFHASFRLRSGGETVFLYSDDGDVLVDQRGYVDLEDGVSVGRYPDGADSGVNGRDFAFQPAPRNLTLATANIA